MSKMRAVALSLTMLIFHLIKTNSAVTCRAGYEKGQENMNDFCRRCAHPLYSDAEAILCIPCPVPKVSHDGITCNFCDDGFGYDDTLEDCTKCPPHHQSVDGLCAPCVNGYTNIGEQTCISCSNDLIADLRLLRCRCEYGKELSVTEECLQCPEATPYSDGIRCKDCVGHANIASPGLSYEHDHNEHDHNGT